MSISISYESEYYFYEKEDFTITPTSLTGTPTNITITTNNKTLVNSTTLAIDQSGVITGTTKSITGQSSSGEVTLTVTMTDDVDTITATIKIIVMFNLKFCKSFSTTPISEGTNVVYTYIQGTAVDELITGYGYKTTYSGSGNNVKPYLLSGLRFYFKNKTSTTVDNFGQKFYLKDYANEIGSCEYDLVIQGGPTNERKSLKQHVIVNVYPKPDLEYEKYDYTFFTNKDFEIVPTQLIDNPVIKSISQRNNLQFNSSSCIISGNYNEPISFSPYFNVQSIYTLTKTPTWNKKTFNINVINPSVSYEDTYYFLNQKFTIKPLLNCGYNNVFSSEEGIEINPSTGEISYVLTSPTAVIPVRMLTYDDANNMEEASTMACIKVIQEDEVFGVNDVIVNKNDVMIKPNITIPVTGTTTFTANNLPEIFSLDPATGIITRKVVEPEPEVDPVAEPEANSEAANTFNLRATSNRSVNTFSLRATSDEPVEPLETYNFDITMNHEGETPEESFTKDLPITLNIVPPSFNYDEVNQYTYTEVSIDPIIDGVLTSFSCDDLHGFVLDESTGRITGTVSDIGVIELLITGTDGTPEGTVQTTLTIVGKDSTITELSYDNIDILVGTSIELTPVNDGNVLTYEITDGQLPSGLTLNSSTGVISGAPTEMMLGTATITATTAVNSMSAVINVKSYCLKIITVLM